MMSAQGTVDILVDVNDPHRQLYQGLQSACQHSRKHSRTSSYDTVESDWSSDISGRFDDADESDSSPQLTGSTSPSDSHSAKRRRSNDWPNQPSDQSQPQPQQHHTHHHNLWPFHHGKTSTSRSPRTSPATGKRPVGYSASSKNRGRRSRFVEESMNDSVSEKPPSIFLREDPHTSSASSASRNGSNGPGQRNSGIFRFGKAIASAFNPFGVWGNVSDMWKNASPEGNKSAAANDALAQAEKAYAELKKAGYKGTAKGSYLQQQQQQNQREASASSEQTWKDDNKAARRHSRQNSGEGQSSIRSSFQDLRRAKSTLGITSIPLLSNANRRSEESEGVEVRRQKSRRELQKQAKLLKRVSNLEDKLERARRELQQLMGEEESQPQAAAPAQSQPEPPETTAEPATTTLCQEEKSYHRKFVPGALPSLPSERLLQEESTPLGLMSDNVQRTPAKDKGKTGKKPGAPKSPKQLTEDQTPGLAIDSPSLKRKSPEPGSAAIADATERAQETAQSDNDEKFVVAEVKGPSPKTKVPKTTMGDSPRSVEHKQSRDRLQSPGENKRERKNTPPPSSRHTTGRRTPSSRRSATSRNVTPCLRMKKGRSDLRSATTEHSLNDDPDKENQDVEFTPRRRTLQEQPKTSPSPSPSKRKHSYSYIPPVPPLPKELVAAAAKLDRRGKTMPGGEQYKWPEDIF